MKKLVTVLLLTCSIINVYGQRLKSKQALSSITPVVAGFSDGIIEKEELLNAEKLSFRESEEALSYTITSFRMTVVLYGSEPKEYFNNENGTITPEMKEVIRELIPGAKIYFEYIKFKDGSTGTNRSAPSLNFTLK